MLSVRAVLVLRSLNAAPSSIVNEDRQVQQQQSFILLFFSLANIVAFCLFVCLFQINKANNVNIYLI